MTKSKLQRPSPERPEVLVQFWYGSTCHKIVIFYQDKGWLECWHAEYVRSGGIVEASVHAMSRDELLERVASFMVGHGSGLLANLLQDAQVLAN
jgi:hypothetical protein